MRGKPDLSNFIRKHRIGVLPSWFATYKPTFGEVIETIEPKKIAIVSATMYSAAWAFGAVGGVATFCGTVLYVMLKERQVHTGWLLKEPPPSDTELASMALKEEAVEEIEEVQEPQDTGFSIAHIQAALDANNIMAKIVGYDKDGPRLVLYTVSVKPGYNINQVAALGDNLSRDLELPQGVRISVEANIGNGYAGIFVPKLSFTPIDAIKEIVRPQQQLSSYELPCLVGHDFKGDLFAFDLKDAVHTLVAGMTGAGKSVQLANMILSMAFYVSPERLKITMIDPKKVELGIYEELPHLTQSPITDMVEAVKVLQEIVDEMNARYETFKKAGVRNITEYNKKYPNNPMPYHVSIVDEVGNFFLNDGKAFPYDKINKATIGDMASQLLVSLTQMGRACGMFGLFGTQRFDAKTFDGQFRTNITSSLGFTVKKATESNMIIGQPGCENLAGKGDCLALINGMSAPIRVQAAFISDSGIETMLAAINKKWKKPLELISESTIANS